MDAGTFKIQKLELVPEGYKPMVVSDPLVFYNSAVGSYCELDTCLYEEIVSMRCRLWSFPLLAGTSTKRIRPPPSQAGS